MSRPGFIVRLKQFVSAGCIAFCPFLTSASAQEESAHEDLNAAYTAILDLAAIYGAEPFSELMRMDTNGDGRIDVGDRISLSEDFDGDGVVDATDKMVFDLLIGDGAMPGWGLLDFNSDGHLDLLDYEIASDDPLPSFFVENASDMPGVMRRPSSGVSLAYVFVFSAGIADWETVFRPANLGIRAMLPSELELSEPLHANMSQAGQPVWIMSDLSQDVSRMPVSEIRAIKDPDNGMLRVLIHSGDTNLNDLGGMLVTETAVIDLFSGRVLASADKLPKMLRKGSIERKTNGFASMLNMLVLPTFAETTPGFQRLSIRQMIKSQARLKEIEASLTENVKRLIADFQRAQADTAGDPCKEVDCEAARAAFQLLLRFDQTLSQAASMARALSVQFDKHAENDRKIASALGKGWAKQDTIQNIQKGLLVLSDLATLNPSSGIEFLNSLLKGQGIGSGSNQAAKKLGLSPDQAKIFAGAITSGANVNLNGLTTGKFDVLKNGYAADIKRIRRMSRQYGRLGVLKGIANSPSLLGFVQSIMKSYADKDVNKVEARADAAAKERRLASQAFYDSLLASTMSSWFAKEISFTAQRLDQLRDTLSDAIKQCLDAGQSKACRKTYNARIAEIAKNEVARENEAKQNLDLAEKALKTRDAAYSDALQRASEAHESLKAARNGSAADVDALKGQLQHQQNLLRTSEDRLREIARQQKEFGVDLGASRMQWAQVKLDATSRIGQLQAKLDVQSNTSSPDPAKLEADRAAAWAKVDQARSQLGPLSQARRDAWASLETATRAREDAERAARRELDDCIAKGAKDPALTRSLPGTSARDASALILVEDIFGPVENAYVDVANAVIRLKPKIITTAGCDKTANDQPATGADDALNSDETALPIRGGDPLSISGLYDAFYHSRIRITIDGNQVTGVLEKTSEPIMTTGYFDGMVLFEGELGQDGMAGTTVIPMDWMPGCEGVLLEYGIRIDPTFDAKSILVEVEEIQPQPDCSIVKVGGWREIPFARLE
ncbi:MAG: hypothetical protein K8F59_04455 [Rhodobacteraceae bacterium]|nr:hypothetical protein [Paracoccaceae bacterium]